MIKAATILHFIDSASPKRRLLRGDFPSWSSHHLRCEVILMLQIDFSDPIQSMSMLVMVAIIVIWIIAELRLEGGVKSAIRIGSALILSVLFMLLMTISGLINF